MRRQTFSLKRTSYSLDKIMLWRYLAMVLIYAKILLRGWCNSLYQGNTIWRQQLQARDFEARVDFATRIDTCCGAKSRVRLQTSGRTLTDKRREFIR
ncbi:hypothetical protein Trydic_g17015 [Trypoxylus dichotomus]